MPRNANKNLKKSKSYTVVRDGAKTKRPPAPAKPAVNHSEDGTPPAEDSSEH